jgi:hypothetical protein
VAHFQQLHEDTIVRAAEMVLLGKVDAISDPKWNQDSGAAWMSSPEGDASTTLSEVAAPAPFPYYTVTIEVIEPWRGNVASGDLVTVYVLGSRPRDDIHGRADAVLVRDARVIAMLSTAEWGWRNSMRKRVLTPVGGYQGLYRVREDGALVNAADDRSDPGGSPVEGIRDVGELRTKVAAVVPGRSAPTPGG